MSAPDVQAEINQKELEIKQINIKIEDLENGIQNVIRSLKRNKLIKKKSYQIKLIN
jgi:ribosomal protein S11